MLAAVVEGAADALTADAPRLAEIVKLTLAALAVDAAPVRTPPACACEWRVSSTYSPV